MHLERNVELTEQIDLLTNNVEDDAIVFDQLDQLNKWTLNHLLIRKAIEVIVEEFKRDGKKRIRLVDLGCADGRQTIMIRNLLSNAGFEVSAIGMDFNPNLVDRAKEKYGELASFEQVDIISNSFKLPICDLVFSSQFAYRFDNNDFVRFLSNNSNQVEGYWLFSEINRSRWMYHLFRIFGKWMKLHDTTYNDGLTAILKNWNFGEFSKLADDAGVKLFRKWNYPHRFSIILQ